MINLKSTQTYCGEQVDVYTVEDGISVDVSTLGATILAVRVPSRTGTVDVVLGMTNPIDMIEKGDYMGSTVGRCGNRIANGRFTLNGKKYKLDCNEPHAHLHGGFNGFNKRIFKAETDKNTLTLSLLSPDGDQGYPGNLIFAVKYTVKDCSLIIEYVAVSDKDTVLNPTNHAYFNLNGESDGSILDNLLKINADGYLQTNGDLIPICKAETRATPFDFSEFKSIGQDIGLVGGYDHNFCLNGEHAASAYSVKTGVQMDVYTDMPGIQFYSGNFLKGNTGKSRYDKFGGFCLETQYFPNAINSKEFVRPILKKGDRFYSRTTYSFSLKESN